MTLWNFFMNYFFTFTFERVDDRKGKDASGRAVRDARPATERDRRRAAALLGRLNALSMDASGHRDTLGELLPHASDECPIRPPFTATMVTACSSDVAFSLTSTA